MFRSELFIVALFALPFAVFELNSLNAQIQMNSFEDLKGNPSSTKNIQMSFSPIVQLMIDDGATTEPAGLDGTSWHVGFVDYDGGNAYIVGWAQNTLVGTPGYEGWLVGKYSSYLALDPQKKPDEIWLVRDLLGDGIGVLDGGSWIRGADDTLYLGSEDIGFGPGKVRGDLAQLPAWDDPGTTLLLPEMTLFIPSSIVTTGDVNPSYNGSGPWTISGDLSVGVTGTGTLNIESGGVVNVTGNTYLGESAGGSGQINFANGTLNTQSLLASPGELRGTGTINTAGIVSDVDLTFDAVNGLQQQIVLNSLPGQDITVNIDANPAYPGPLGVGYRGAATLTIADGMTVDANMGFLGYHAGADGTANVTGAGSKWLNKWNLYVGLGGTGTLNIESGGLVDTFDSGTIGRYSGSTGIVTVRGMGSEWDISSDLNVGYDGTGTLSIEDGGLVRANVTGVRSDSTVNLIGGTLLTRYLDVLSGTLNIQSSSLVNVSEVLFIGFLGTGTVNLLGGTLDMNGGYIRVGSGNGSFNFTDGTLTNTTTIDLGQPFIQQGGTLAPGASPGETSIVGDYVQQAGATIEIELHGVSNQGVDYDHLDVSGNANISGTLDLQIGGGYLPALGDEADIITFGSQTGTFTAITNVAQAGNLGLAVRYGYDANQIDVRVSVRGDTDFDDDVDTGDLTTAIVNFTGGTGIGNTWINGDFDGDGDTDTGDLTTAIVNFTGASAANPNVPDLVYDPATGNVTIDADGADVISFSLQGGPFSTADFGDLPAGLTDNIAAQIGWTSFNLFSGLTGVAELGAILPAGLDEAQLTAALSTATYGLALSGGGGGGTFDIIIPEPGAMTLLLAAMAIVRRRRVA